jgi:hypothetical protein
MAFSSVAGRARLPGVQVSDDRKPGMPLAVPVRPTRLAATTRERIAAGTKFVVSEHVTVCAACRGYAEAQCPGDVDMQTGLGPVCWVAWRWSAIRECDLP